MGLSTACMQNYNTRKRLTNSQLNVNIVQTLKPLRQLSSQESIIENCPETNATTNPRYCDGANNRSPGDSKGYVNT